MVLSDDGGVGGPGGRRDGQPVTWMGWPSRSSAASWRPSLSVGCGWIVPARSPGAAISSTASAPGAGELAGVRADDVDADDAVGGGVGDEAGEAVAGAERRGAARRGQRERRDPRVQAGVPRLGLARGPTLATSGSVNTTTGIAAASKAAGRPLSASAATAASAVALWASAGPGDDVADRRDALGGAQVGARRAISPSAPDGDARGREAQLVGVGDAARRPRRRARRRRAPRRPGRGRRARRRPGARPSCPAAASTPSARRRRSTGAVSVRVDGRQDAVQRLDDRHARRRAWPARCRAPGRCSPRRRRRRCPARRVSASAPVESRTRSPSNGRPGSSMAREPVATIACSNSKNRTRSSGVRTATRPGRLNRASPCTTRVPPAASSSPTPRARPRAQLARARTGSARATPPGRRPSGPRPPARGCGAPRRPARSAPCWGCSRPGGRRRRAPPAPPRSTSTTSAPELRGADRGDVAAGPPAEDEQVDRLGELADDHQRRSSSSSTGSSSSAATWVTNAAERVPVEHAVVARDGEDQRRADDGRAVDRDHLVADRADAEVDHLGRLDDRRAQPDAEAAVVVDRERRRRRAARDAAAARARPPRARRSRARRSASDRWSASWTTGTTSPSGSGRRDADVAVAMQRDLLALEVDRRVDVGMVAQRADRRLDDQRRRRHRARQLLVAALQRALLAAASAPSAARSHRPRGSR